MIDQEKGLNIGLLFDVLKNYGYGTKTEVFEKGRMQGVTEDKSEDAVIQSPEEFDKTKVGNSLDHTLYWVTKAREAEIPAYGIVLASTFNYTDDQGEARKKFLSLHAFPILYTEEGFIYPETSLGGAQKVNLFSDARSLIRYAEDTWDPMAAMSAAQQQIPLDRMEVWFYDPMDYTFIGIDIVEFYRRLNEKGDLFEKYIPRSEPSEVPKLLRESVSKRQQRLIEKYLDKEIEPKKNKFETHSDDGFFELCRKKVLDDLLKDENEKMEFYDFWMWCLDVGADDLVELTLHDLEDGNLSDDSHVKAFYDVYAHLKDEAKKDKDAFLKQYSGGFENKMKKKFPDSFKDDKKKNERHYVNDLTLSDVVCYKDGSVNAKFSIAEKYLASLDVINGKRVRLSVRLENVKVIEEYFDKGVDLDSGLAIAEDLRVAYKGRQPYKHEGWDKQLSEDEWNWLVDKAFDAVENALSGVESTETDFQTPFTKLNESEYRRFWQEYGAYKADQKKMKETDPYTDGYDSCIAMFKNESWPNPYDRGTEEYSKWESGWNDAANDKRGLEESEETPEWEELDGTFCNVWPEDGAVVNVRFLDGTIGKARFRRGKPNSWTSVDGNILYNYGKVRAWERLPGQNVLVESEKKDSKKKEDFSEYNKAITDALKKVESEKAKFSLLESCSRDEYETIVYQVSGGLNGSGKWEDYLDNLADFVVELEKSGEYHTWLIDAKNDCLDDINYFNFGIRKTEDEDTGEEDE